MLNIHQSIKEKLDYFHKIHKIPNIIFHGPYGSGKKTLVNEFISKIYDDNRDKMKTFVMYVNCAHGKGIKFIREELKFFAKTQINTNGGDVFKSIVLINADKLTMDAQSALRRCIELFNHNTRFFIIVEDKYKLLKPILSRFCEIYVSEPVIQGLPINLYKYNVIQAFKKQRETKKDSETKTKVKKETVIKISSKDFLQEDNKKNSELIKEMNKINEMFHNNKDSNNTNIDKSNKLIAISTKLYENGYSGLDIIELLENEKYEVLRLVQQTNNNININNYNEFLLGFNKVRKEFRNEKLLMFFILNFLFLSLDTPLENISIM
jgi:Ni2+-binding GTPase involved in maturation of urease and hydrogenase